MPRKNMIYTDEYPYHIYNRSNNKEYFYIPIKDLWVIFCDVLNKATFKYHVNLHNFVLMDNHYHMDVSTPKKNITAFLNYTQREVARKVNSKLERVNHFWGGRYKWTLITDERYYFNIFKYIYQNPCRANIANNPMAYPYSTVHELTANRSDLFLCPPIYEELCNLQYSQLLSILNTSLSAEDIRCIRGGLKYKEFRPLRSKTSMIHSLAGISV